MSENLIKQYWRQIKPKTGVLFIVGSPGTAKSAIGLEIADRHDLRYIDIRLGQVDEADVGLFPITPKSGEKFFNYAIPSWAALANDPGKDHNGTLIHFEELNRCSLAVRNAALQMLNERGIGFEFKFNENVYMMASGNLGEEDKCDVEELDMATLGRLIKVKHKMTIDDWVSGYAEEHVLPQIVEFVRAHPGRFMVMGDEGEPYASPRSWTSFSKYLEINGIMDDSNMAQEAFDHGYSYVGPSAYVFSKFLSDRGAVAINEVIENYPSIKSKVEKLERAVLTELVLNLQHKNVAEFDDDNCRNVVEFLTLITPDIRASMLTHYLNALKDARISAKTVETVQSIIRPFKDETLKLMSGAAR
jgi:hypothetical protein